MAVIKKYVLVIPKDISNVNGVYRMTLPTGAIGFTAIIVCTGYNPTPYEPGADNRQVWVLKGEEADLNNWISINSDMVIEKTFDEANALCIELKPERNYTVHKVTTEDGVIVSESDVLRTMPAFDLQARLVELGL